MDLAHPEWIVSTDWLEEHLADPEIRILEATVHLDRSLDEKEGARQEYEAAHVPGAVFLDHVEDLSDSGNPVPYARLGPEPLAAAFAQAGISDDSRVVVYSASHLMWATRVLWLLHGIGFDRVAVLDGGFMKWKQEGRPQESGPSSPEVGSLTARSRPEVWADRADVEASIVDGGVCTLNALPRTLFTGEAAHHYGRPGRIAGSESVPFSAVVDGRTGCFKDPAAWRAAFEATGAFERERAITYCGGGISATVDAFALVQLGHRRVAVYDGSLLEWSADPELPMETG